MMGGGLGMYELPQKGPGMKTGLGLGLRLWRLGLRLRLRLRPLISCMSDMMEGGLGNTGGGTNMSS